MCCHIVAEFLRDVDKFSNLKTKQTFRTKFRQKNLSTFLSKFNTAKQKNNIRPEFCGESEVLFVTDARVQSVAFEDLPFGMLKKQNCFQAKLSLYFF